jgi:hypothetical protein
VARIVAVPIKVEMLSLPYVRAMLWAAADLLNDVEQSDTALLPDSVVEKAAALRSAMEAETR